MLNIQQNEYLAREINDLTRLIGFRFSEERFKREMKNVELIYDQNPFEGDKKMQILKELYENIKNHEIIQ
jgi:hypothetical protein